MWIGYRSAATCVTAAWAWLAGGREAQGNIKLGLAIVKQYEYTGTALSKPTFTAILAIAVDPFP